MLCGIFISAAEYAVKRTCAVSLVTPIKGNMIINRIKVILQ